MNGNMIQYRHSHFWTGIYKLTGFRDMRGRDDNANQLYTYDLNLGICLKEVKKVNIYQWEPSYIGNVQSDNEEENRK